jgi:hypothetical protein
LPTTLFSAAPAGSDTAIGQTNAIILQNFSLEMGRVTCPFREGSGSPVFKQKKRLEFAFWHYIVHKNGNSRLMKPFEILSKVQV